MVHFPANLDGLLESLFGFKKDGIFLNVSPVVCKMETLRMKSTVFWDKWSCIRYSYLQRQAESKEWGGAKEGEQLAGLFCKLMS